MAINETIATGRKFRKLIDEVNKIWQRISFWTKAEDVEFNDGSTAEIKIGAINGVTDSLTSTASNVAASAAAVKALNDKVTELSSNIRAIDLGTGTSFDVTKYAGYKNFTADNFVIEPQNANSTNNGRGHFPEGNMTITLYNQLTKTKTYNAASGILTAYYTVMGGTRLTYDGNLGDYDRPNNCRVNVHAYLIP